MIETIAAVNQAVNSFIWGIPAMVCIIGVGLLLSVRTGFLQIRKFPYAIRTTVGRMFRKRDASDGAMPRFDSVRPLLAGDDRAARIRSIMLERGPVYDEVCNEKVITSRKPIDFVVEKILALESVREVTQHKLEGGEK